MELTSKLINFVQRCRTTNFNERSFKETWGTHIVSAFLLFTIAWWHRCRFVECFAWKAPFWYSAYKWIKLGDQWIHLVKWILKDSAVTLTILGWATWEISNLVNHALRPSQRHNNVQCSLLKNYFLQTSTNKTKRRKNMYLRTHPNSE